MEVAYLIGLIYACCKLKILLFTQHFSIQDESDRLPFPNDENDFTLPDGEFSDLLDEKNKPDLKDDEKESRGRGRPAKKEKDKDKNDEGMVYQLFSDNVVVFFFCFFFYQEQLKEN